MQIDSNYKIMWMRWPSGLRSLSASTGHGNEDARYTKGGTVLNTTVKDKYLGLTISTDGTYQNSVELQQQRETKLLN